MSTKQAIFNFHLIFPLKHKFKEKKIIKKLVFSFSFCLFEIQLQNKNGTHMNFGRPVDSNEKNRTKFNVYLTMS